MVNWQILLNPKFWFSIGWNPLSLPAAEWMAGFFVILLIIGIVLPRAATARPHVPKFERTAWSKVRRPFVVAGLLGLLFTFFAYEQIAIFSARFWFLVIALGFVISEILAVRNLIIEIPQLKEEQEERAAREKYLP